MPNALNELTDLYESLNLNGNGGGGGTIEDGNNSIDAIMRINSFLNNSLDLRNINADNARKSSIVNRFLDILSLTLSSRGRFWGVGVSLSSNKSSSVGSSHDPSVPLSRLLAQSYSYSSDSSGTPNTPLTPRSAPQMLSRNSGVFRDDSSPMSSPYSGNRFYNFTYPGSVGYHRNRQSTTSDPGSPTMDEALLMGRPDGVRSPSQIDYNQQNKVNDITIADLVSTLSMNGGGNPVSMNNGSSPHSVSGMPGSPMGSMSRSAPTMPSNTLMNMIQQQQQMPSNLSQPNLNNSHMQNNLQNNQALNQLSQLPQGVDLASLQAQLQNAWLTTRILPGLVDGTNLLGDSRNGPSGPLANLLASATDPYSIEKAAKMHRNAAAVCDATCTWSGQLPQRMHKNPTYSCKILNFSVRTWKKNQSSVRPQDCLHVGRLRCPWTTENRSSSSPVQDIFLLPDSVAQVKGLLSACSQDFSIGGNYYYKISSRRIRQKEVVQVIPWVVSDSNYVRCPSYQLDPAKTVFVGALHGMLSAEGLANIMNDLFGGVVYSGIDTDKHKYPIGSGRVTFNNVQSYRKAVRAAFIEIKTPKFTKKVQVDPYLADSLCQLCGMQQGPYFCRDENCFKYFCRSCWQLTHPMDTHNGGCGHKPLMRNSKLRTQTTLSRVI
ncbi:unnamed protein product, partial [Meganyctiphanes norvegica]